MATYVKGDEVTKTTDGTAVTADVNYELFEKNSDGTYTSLATGEIINFEVSALGLAAGNHTLVVQAQSEGYENSDYSNEEVYIVEAKPTQTIYENTALTLDAYKNVTVTTEFANCIVGEKYIVTVSGGILRLLCNVDTSVDSSGKYYPWGSLGVSADGTGSTNVSPYEFVWTEEAASATLIRLESRNAETTTYSVSITGPKAE